MVLIRLFLFSLAAYPHGGHRLGRIGFAWQPDRGKVFAFDSSVRLSNFCCVCDATVRKPRLCLLHQALSFDVAVISMPCSSD